MAGKPSRRKIAQFLADALANGESPKRVAKVLISYLAESKQLRMVELYMRDIQTELANRHGHVAAEVISARKLSSDVRQNLIKLVRDETDAKTVELMETIDEELIGGVLLRTPDAEMDNSVAKTLTKLRSI